MIKGIQIIGTQRSGSNLFRLMLNQVKEISAPHPPHIIDRFYPLLIHYGDLNQDSNFNRLIEDVCEFVACNPVSWSLPKPFVQDVKLRCKKHSLFEIFRVIYELKAESVNAKFWCCKSMANINYVNQLEESKIYSKYIHLYRDGRDVALSFKKAIVGEKHIYHLSKKWSKEQKQGLDLLNKLGNGRVMQVRYEDLICNPVQVLKQVCEFLKISYDPKILDYYVSKDSISTASSGEMWKNVANPIINNNFNKFKKELSLEEIKIFENVANNTLIALGYSPFLSTNESSRVFTDCELKNFDTENARLKEDILNKISEEDIKKRLKQKELLNKIMAR